MNKETVRAIQQYLKDIPVIETSRNHDEIIRKKEELTAYLWGFEHTSEKRWKVDHNPPIKKDTEFYVLIEDHDDKTWVNENWKFYTVYKITKDQVTFMGVRYK